MGNNLKAVLLLLFSVTIVGSLVLAFTQTVRHHYTENIAACSRRNFVKSATSMYAPARCTDPKTGIMYDPQYLGPAQ